MAPRKTCQRLVASCLAAAGGMLPATVFAQPPTPAAGAERATAHAVYVTESPRIDGVLDEPMWSAIEPVSAFTQRQPNKARNRASGPKCASPSTIAFCSLGSPSNRTDHCDFLGWGRRCLTPPSVRALVRLQGSLLSNEVHDKRLQRTAFRRR